MRRYSELQKRLLDAIGEAGSEEAVDIDALADELAKIGRGHKFDRGDTGDVLVDVYEGADAFELPDNDVGGITDLSIGPTAVISRDFARKVYAAVFDRITGGG